MFKVYQVFCAIWYHLYNLKNVKTPMDECLLLKSCAVTLLKVVLLDGCFLFFHFFYLIFK